MCRRLWRWWLRHKTNATRTEIRVASGHTVPPGFSDRCEIQKLGAVIKRFEPPDQIEQLPGP